MRVPPNGGAQLVVTGSAAFLLLLVLARSSLAAQLSTPWVTLERTDKDRAISRQPWATYESSSDIGINGVTPPTSPAAALDPANYQIAAGGGAAGPAITEVSYRSRLLFLSLRPTSNFPNPAAWGHHVFLKLASPLQGGQTYTITAAAAVFGSAVSVQLAVDEQQQLNENIHVNQVGYQVGSPKVAVVGSYLGSLTAAAPFIPATLRLPGGDASPFTVEDAASGAVAFTGTARLFGDGSVHEYFKQLSWQLDFSGLVTPGRYHVRLPGLGLSHAFAIGNDALAPALGALARSMYGQRCGVALEQAFLSPWERPEPCHKDDAEVMAIDPPPAWFTSKMPLPAANGLTTLPPDPATGSYFLPQAPGGTKISAVGGSHDAGDYGKYVINSGSFVGWLMNSLEILGAENDDLPLPEAGDGVPDLLQVVQHELKFLEGMQDEDGGVFCVVKPNTTAGEYYEHHQPCGTPGKDTCNMAPNDPKRGARIAWPKDTTCTAQFAGAMARAARSPWMQTFRPADAARYLSRALKAWNFLQTKAPLGAACYHFYGCLGVLTAADASPPPWHNTYNCYDPQGDQSHDERMWAAVELFAATGQESYHSYFLERHCPRYRRWGWVMLPFSYGLATVTYAQLAAQAKQPGGTTLQLNATMAAKCLDELATTARGYTAQAQASPYFLAVTERSFSVFGYGWQFQSSVAAHMLMAAAIAADTPAEAATWRSMAAAQLNYVLGANPQGFSLITGVGARRITNPVDDESVYDYIDAPWPGQIVALAGGFSWLNEVGAAQGAAFPPGGDYALFNRIADGFNVATEYTVPELALAIGAFAGLIGQTKTPLPLPPSVSVQPSTVSGPAPLTVDFQLSVAGAEGDVASLEWDFGDGGHSYQAAPRHTFQEPGRAFSGFATVVDRRGQASVQKFSVFTSFAEGASPELPPPAGLALVARVDHAAGTTGAVLPPLLVASQIAAGGNTTLGTSVTADVVTGMAATQDNLAWQGPKGAWTGAALRPTRFEDRASYDVAGSSSSSTQLVLAGASGGLVLDAWVYFKSFLTYGRDNVYLLGLVGRDNVLFGLFGTKWTGNQLVAGAFGAVANDEGLKPAFTLGRWHHIRLAALLPAAGSTGNGTCTAWVDGTAVGSKDCAPSGIFKLCASSQALKLVVGSFDGYVDAVKVFASPTADLAALCGARPPPPPSPPPPAPPAPDQRFAPLLVTTNTIAVVEADSSCGLTGDAVAAGLPMRLFSGGYATGSLLPAAATFAAGLTVSSNNNRWEPVPVGCSLHVASEATTNGSATIKFQLPQSLLQRAITNNAFSIEAKLFVQAWRTGYSKWNADVFGVGSNWDTFFKITHDIWRGPSVLLSTPSASTTGAFAGTLRNASALEEAVFVNSWHHVAFAANATSCVFSVDGREVAAGACEAKKLLWAKTMDITVGGFVGYVDELALTAAAVTTQVPNSVASGTTRQPPVPPAPSPPPPPSPPSPPPPKPVNRFSPLAVDASTIAVLETDSLCGVSGGALNSSLVLRLFSGGAATGGAIAPASLSYTTGLSISDANTQWAVTPSGCSLRVASEPVSGGNALVTWRLPKALLQPAIAANAFTLTAKVYVDKWRVGYSKWNSQVLSHSCNWDTYFNIGTDIWKAGYVQLSTPSAATTGAFAGTLANVTTLEAALTPEVWHHVALIANSTTCVFSVDGVEVAAGGCSASKLLWQTYLTVSVGGFVGYVDELVVSAAARPTQVPLKP